MELQLKNIQHFERGSQETNNYVGDLFVNGKKVASVSNDGHGGSTFVQAYSMNCVQVVRDAEAFAKTLPPYEYTGFDDKPSTIEMTLDFWCDNQLDNWLEQKEKDKFAKRMKKDFLTKLCIGTAENYFTVNWGKHTIEHLLSTPKGMEAITKAIKDYKAKGRINETAVILNTNIPADFIASALNG